MGVKTGIEWAGSTWSPIRARNLATGKVGWHCTHASDGCRFCYSEAMNIRLGTGLPFKPGHEKDIEVFLDEKMLLSPLRWKKSRKIFLNSMTDTFGEFVKDEWLDKIFAVMALTPRHIYQVLTKRPHRMLDYVGVRHSRNEIELAAEKIRPAAGTPFAPKHVLPWPLENVWLGISAENQPNADERIPILLQTPAAVRFVSLEPLLGPIDLANLERGDASVNALDGKVWYSGAGSISSRTLQGKRLNWVIVGGESGTQARPMKIEWVYDLVSQCRANGVASFVKQLGAVPTSSGYPLELRDRKGGDSDEWPGDLRVREFPTVLAA